MAQNDYRIGTGSLSKELMDSFDRMLLQSSMAKDEEDLSTKIKIVGELGKVNVEDDTSVATNNISQLAKIKDEMDAAGKGNYDEDYYQLVAMEHDNLLLNIKPSMDQRDLLIAQNTKIHQALSQFSANMIDVEGGTYGLPEDWATKFGQYDENAIKILNDITTSVAADIDDLTGSHIEQIRKDRELFGKARFVLNLFDSQDDKGTDAIEMPQGYTNPMAQSLWDQTIMETKLGKFDDAHSTAQKFLDSESDWVAKQANLNLTKEPPTPVNMAKLTQNARTAQALTDRNYINSLTETFKASPQFAEAMGNLSATIATPWTLEKLTKTATPQEVNTRSRLYENTFVNLLKDSKVSDEEFEIEGKMVKLTDLVSQLKSNPRGTTGAINTEYSEALRQIFLIYQTKDLDDQGITQHGYNSLIKDAPGSFDETEFDWFMGQMSRTLLSINYSEDLIVNPSIPSDIQNNLRNDFNSLFD